MGGLYDVVVHHIIVRGELKMFRSKHKHILCCIDMSLSFLSFVAIIAGRLGPQQETRGGDAMNALLMPMNLPYRRGPATEGWEFS